MNTGMTTNNKYQFKGFTSKLPEFEPEENLWEKIEATLDFDVNLYSAIGNLPAFDPDTHLWDTIEPKIRKPNNFMPIFIRWSAVAATVAILVTLSFLLTMQNSKSKMMVETEVVSKESSAILQSPDVSEKIAIAVIEENCKLNKVVCESPDFKEKVLLYYELESEQKQLEQIIGAIGESPEMVKALIRIENMKSTTLQELISLMNS
jgi:hypothetical protein